jgi:hypothetical protein
MKSITQNHNSFLIPTDLEPDDILALLILIKKISEAASSKNKMKIAFLVGEGHAGIKVARLKKYLSKLPPETWENLEYQIIQGHDNLEGSQKYFSADGKEVLDEIEIATAKQSTTTAEKISREIQDYLYENKNTAIISIMPMLHFVNLFDKLPNIFSVREATLYASGSYNFRQTIKRMVDDMIRLEKLSGNIDAEKLRDEYTKMAEQKLATVLGAFKATHIYETYTTTHNNNTKITLGDSYFANALKNLLSNWADACLAKDRLSAPKEISKLKEKDIITIQESEELLSLLQSQYSETTRPIFDKWVAIIASKKMGQSEDVAKILSDVGRTLNKWRNLSVTNQIVTADPSLAIILTCDLPENLVFAEPVKIEFLADYLKIIPDETSSIRVFLPLPCQQYLALREEEKTLREKAASSREKVSAPAALIAAQKNLLAALTVNFDEAILWINQDCTLSKKRGMSMSS